MRKSKLANICLYTSLGVILLNILAVIIMFTKTPSNFIKVMSRLYSPVMILSVVIFIASIISLVRILISKGQLKGLAKSIAALVLSVVMFIGAFAQGLLAEAVISINRAVDSTVSEVGQETPSNSLPKFVRKDFDIVAVAKYSDKNNPGYYIAGFIDKSGDFVIEPKFRDAKDFYEGLAPVKAKENGKWGYIDKSGEFVIKPQFDDADIFSSGVAAVKVNGKWGYIDKTGNFTIQPSFDEPTRFVEGLAILESQDTGKTGYMDTTGNFVVDPQFEYASRYFSEGLSLVLKDANDFTTAGFVDKEGKFMNIPIYRLNYNGFFSEGLFPICKKGEEYYGYIDKTGEFVIEPKFLSCDIFSEGLAAAMPQGEGKYGYIDKTGNIVIEPNYTLAFPFSDGLALVMSETESDARYGYIDKTGNYIVEPKFYGAESFSEGLALVYEKNKGQGFIDKTGKYVIGPILSADFGRFHKVDAVFDPKKANLNELKID
ncbi:MAG: hypothetical protein PWP27_1831 [Clostridiales bacterium]|jgi:hypothetical protein|nr:hypothetical protein [Clostridiales bacterium]MDK2934021.1 hypothetical protein [Clostridiales bacterium]